MSEPSAPESGCPVATAAATWSAWPEVLADPDQRGPHGVWTRREDVLAPLDPRSGRRVAWGEVVWTATARWDPEDPDLLWLEPLAAPADPPDPATVHAPDHWAAAIAAEIAHRLGASDPPDGLVAVIAEVVQQRLAALLTDFGATVAVLRQRVRADRNLARTVLDDLGSLPAPVARAALDTPAVRRLHRLARRPHAPR